MKLMMQTLSLMLVFVSAMAFAETKRSPFQTEYTILEGADKVLDTQDKDLTIEAGRTALKPTPAIASGVTLTVDGTLLTTDVISGAGTLAGSGTVARVDEQDTFGSDKTFGNDLTVSNDLQVDGDVTIGGTLFGGSPLDIGSILSLTDEGGTDTEIMRFSRQLDSTDFTAVMSRQVPSQGLALDFETNFYNGASRETRQAMSILPSGVVDFPNNVSSTRFSTTGTSGKLLTEHVQVGQDGAGTFYAGFFVEVSGFINETCSTTCANASGDLADIGYDTGICIAGFRRPGAVNVGCSNGTSGFSNVCLCIGGRAP